MFDEFNEGNQIAKTAPDATAIPAGTTFIGLSDEDGTACSSDYYLRLTGDGGRMRKGQIALTAVRPTQPMAAASVSSPENPSDIGDAYRFRVLSLRNGARIEYSAPFDNSGVEVNIITRAGRVV